MYFQAKIILKSNRYHNTKQTLKKWLTVCLVLLENMLKWFFLTFFILIISTQNDKKILKNYYFNIFLSLYISLVWKLTTLKKNEWINKPILKIWCGGLGSRNCLFLRFSLKLLASIGDRCTALKQYLDGFTHHLIN